MEDFDNKKKKPGKYELLTVLFCLIIILGIIFIVLRLTNVIGGNKNSGKPSVTASPDETAKPAESTDEPSKPTDNPSGTPDPGEEETPAPSSEPTAEPTATPTATPTPTSYIENNHALKQTAEIEINSTPDARVFVNQNYAGKVDNVSFKTNPDLSYLGKRNVLVCANVDGKYVEVDKELNVVDTTPPVIKGVGDRACAVEEAVKYKSGVTVSDNSGEEIELEVDASEVNIYKVGTYKVYYSAKDSSGNEAKASANIIVSADPSTVNQETVNEKADEILAKIIKEGMTEAEKCTAIYTYIRRNMGYYSKHFYDDVYQNAYQGMTQWYGDCYVYFCYAKVLLDRAGFENMKVSRTTTPHYWNLVKVDGQWYHFDTTPRSSGGEFCLLTDAELKAYSDAHDGTHVYDQSLYPATATESLGIAPKI